MVMACKPDALFISNGPGDPKQAPDAIRCVKDLLGELPVFGICMGNQVSALALGGDTYKLKFGHRGANQPVKYKDGRIFITTQNHGFRRSMRIPFPRAVRSPTQMSTTAPWKDSRTKT